MHPALACILPLHASCTCMHSNDFIRPSSTQPFCISNSQRLMHVQRTHGQRPRAAHSLSARARPPFQAQDSSCGATCFSSAVCCGHGSGRPSASAACERRGGPPPPAAAGELDAQRLRAGGGELVHERVHLVRMPLLHLANVGFMCRAHEHVGAAAAALPSHCMHRAYSLGWAARSGRAAPRA